MNTSDYQKKYVSEGAINSGSNSKPKKIHVKKSYFASISYPYIEEDLEYDTNARYDTSIPQIRENLEDSYSADDTKYVFKLV